MALKFYEKKKQILKVIIDIEIHLTGNFKNACVKICNTHQGKICFFLLRKRNLEENYWKLYIY